MTITLATDAEAEEVALQSKALTLVEEARALRITGAPEYQAASAFQLGIAALRKEITTFFAPLKKKADETHKAICAAEKDKLAPVVEAEQHVGALILTYRREEQKRIADRAAQDQAALRKAAEDKRLAEAARLEALGRPEEALAKLDAPVLVPIVVPCEASIPKVAGLGFRETWKAEVTDKAALLCFVAGHPEYENLFTVNQPALDSMARAQRSGLRLPGVAPYSVESAVARTAAAGR
jgi:hypothetical protein